MIYFLIEFLFALTETCFKLIRWITRFQPGLPLWVIISTMGGSIERNAYAPTQRSAVLQNLCARVETSKVSPSNQLWTNRLYHRDLIRIWSEPYLHTIYSLCLDNVQFLASGPVWQALRFAFSSASLSPVLNNLTCIVYSKQSYLN